MPRKSFNPEQIIAKLRQIEVLIGQGQSVAGGSRSNCQGNFSLGHEDQRLSLG